MSDVIFHVIILLLLLLLVVFWPFFIDWGQYHVTLKFLRGWGVKYRTSTQDSAVLYFKENPASVIFHFHRNRVTFFNEACKNREIPCISEGHVVHFHSSSCYLASFISRWCLVFPAVMATCSHSQVWNCWNLHLLTRATTSVVSSSRPFFVT